MKKPDSSNKKESCTCFRIKTHLTLVFVLFSSKILFSQTAEQRQQIISKTNVAALQQISSVQGGIARGKRIAAEQWAISHQIPVSGVNENGQEFHIYDYDSISQTPLYLATTNLNSAKTISTDKLWNIGTSGLNLSGNNITITMWDGGRVCDQHTEYINRATSGSYETTVEPISPHATHVAGTQIAAGVDLNAHGMAPSANLIYYGFTDWITEIPLEAANGWLLSNNSWGNLNQGWGYVNPNWYWLNYLTDPEYPRFGLYDVFTQIHDQIANAAPYFLMIRSAGNDRGFGQATNLPHYHNGTCCFTDFHQINGGTGGYDCMDENATAKNVLTIGAVQDIPNGYTNPADVVLASFSNTGPTDDGRIKPDLVANGISLYSSFNNNATNCNTLNYYNLSGTSMSAPSITGSCALLQEHYSNTHSGNFMLASTIKALLIETAEEAGTSNGPDYHHGWGLMNTKKAAEVISEDQNDPSLIQELTLTNGQTIDIPITLTYTNNCYLSATIVWNDPAGVALPISLDPPNLNLVNDFDLRIIDPSTNTNFPWTLDPANPANAAIQTADNFRDNVEQVRIYGAAPGNYIVRITHKGILANPQDFSLIINSANDVDLYTKDVPHDVGIEADPDNGPMWISDDIWVRNTNDGFINQTHQNPIFASNPNYVYVRVRNNGCNPSLGTEQLKLHWAKAASALSWPDYWDIFYNVTCGATTHPMGDIISTQIIPIIPPGGETILEFSWNVPDPDDYNTCNLEPAHFCLLSRILATNDPMTSPEVTSVYDNTKNNNNIAWKNLTIVHMLLASGNEECPHDQVLGGTIAIGNPFHDKDDKYNLEFKLDEKNRGIPLNEQAEIKVTLDDLSWQKWMEGGHLGENIRIKREDCHQLVITGNPATIKNLHYEPMERSTINLSFNFLTDKVDAISEFDYHAIQTRAENNKIIGGELYRIQKPSRYLFSADAGSDKNISEGTTTTLTANNIGESAFYNWYDPDGNLVYSGNNFTVTPEITKKYKLEIIALSDGFSSYDSVTVKIKDCEIQSITPNPATSQITIQYKAQNISSGYIVITHPSGTPNDNYILNLNQNTKIINVSNYAQGNYNVILICNGEIKDTKVLSIQ